MKRILLGLLISFLFATVSYADDGQLKIKADKKGQVILDAKKSRDGNVYILNNVEPGEEFTVMSNAATTFTNKLENGFFDNPIVDYQINFSTYGYMFNSIIDNNTANYGVVSDKDSIQFDDVILITEIYVDSRFLTGIDFYDEAGQLIKKLDFPRDRLTAGYININENVKKMVFNAISGTASFYELEIFAESLIDYIAVKNIKVNAKSESVTATFDNPNSEHFRYNDILLDGKIVKSNLTDTTVELNDLKAMKEYELTIRSYYKDKKYVDAITKFKTQKDTKPPGDVINLTATQNGNDVVLQWDKPTDKDFSHVRITRNSMLVVADLKGTTFTDTVAKLNADNIYRVVAIDENGNFSSGASVKIKVVGTEVFDLRGKATTYQQVDLSWKNPLRDDFKTVRIARKNDDAGLLARMKSVFSSDDEYTDLFQTNGTVFNDLTVNPDTEYTYRLRSVIAGVESSGVTINVKTPKISVSGGGTDVDNEGHYVVKWNTPVTGKIKVLIARKEYAIVPAADKKIIIPKEEMKFDLLGNPDVQLIPIDEEGNEGLPSKPGGGGNNNGGGIGGIIGGGTDAAEITPENTLDMAVGLFLLVGGFLLLGMSFWLVPKLIRVIRQALGNKNGQTEIGRRTS